MITNSGLEMMGFQPIQAAMTFAASFHLIKIDELRGVVLPEEVLGTITIHQGPGYRLTIGRSVNEMCRALMGDDFTDDEPKWQKETGSSPPYTMLHLGPTEVFTATDGHWMRKDGQLVTHGCFRKAKQELAAQEALVVGPALTALCVAFADLPNPVELRPCAREITGITEQGESLHDLEIRLSATAYVSQRVAPEEAARRVERAIRLQKTFEASVVRFYYAGMIETDAMKRFLFFFLFLERLTHSTFRTIDHRVASKGLYNVPLRLVETGAEYLTSAQEGAKTLMQRFMWCALLVWTNLTDDDIREFQLLKTERDRISHGERISAEVSLAKRAQRLASSVLGALGG